MVVSPIPASRSSLLDIVALVVPRAQSLAT
jgi:hypothetical protein